MSDFDKRIQDNLKPILTELLVETRRIITAPDDISYSIDVNITTETEIYVRRYLHGQPARNGELVADHDCEIWFMVENQWRKYDPGLKKDVLVEIYDEEIESIKIIPSTDFTTNVNGWVSSKKLWRSKEWD